LGGVAVIAVSRTGANINPYLVVVKVSGRGTHEAV
jgi:hypothetical protein